MFKIHHQVVTFGDPLGDIQQSLKGFIAIAGPQGFLRFLA
jgi:hypothetical protein